MSAKSFSYPLYEARTEDGTVISGPSSDCSRINNAARSYEGFTGVTCKTIWVATMNHFQIQRFNGERK